jgi:hypothetical protein
MFVYMAYVKILIYLGERCTEAPTTPFYVWCLIQIWYHSYVTCVLGGYNLEFCRRALRPFSSLFGSHYCTSQYTHS